MAFISSLPHGVVSLYVYSLEYTFISRVRCAIHGSHKKSASDLWGEGGGGEVWRAKSSQQTTATDSTRLLCRRSDLTGPAEWCYVRGYEGRSAAGQRDFSDLLPSLFCTISVVHAV